MFQGIKNKRHFGVQMERNINHVEGNLSFDRSKAHFGSQDWQANGYSLGVVYQMRTYTQASHTGVDNPSDTPKNTHEFDINLHGGCTLDAYNTRRHSHRISQNEASFNGLSKIKKMINKKTNWLVLIGSLVAMQGVGTANAATTNTDSLRLYAHSRLVSFEQFVCFNKIITKESNWRVNAKNGSHFGLGQMRSQWYRNLDGFRQIDQTIKYISNRYSTPCKAWSFHQRNNWF